MAKQTRTLEGFLSASSDLIYVFDRKTRYIYVNRSGADALGFKPHQMVGKTIEELGLPAQTLKRHDRPWRHCVRNRSPGDRRVALVRSQDGEKDYEYVLTPIYSEQGVVECGYFDERETSRNASGLRKRVRRERDQAQRELDTAEVLMVVLRHGRTDYSSES